MKNIRELTEEQAKEILKYVFPDNLDMYYRELSFERKIIDGREQITFGGNSIIGICYNDGQDNCCLPFNHTKVLIWLYDHDFDIGEFLKKNFYLSEQENDFIDLLSGLMFVETEEYDTIEDLRKYIKYIYDLAATKEYKK